ncbi:unnamed protein product [Lactuca virosa]|uniref:Uncharacterized protein n=1 Tax=Lactuca virosa TaxID=75947 RepID=A0AAU9N5F0_9ASTR|nr:unnamed protein product [Lactuca virosa]
MAEDDTLVIEVQYNGNFFPRPFMYLDPDKKEIRMCKYVYYCPDGQTLCQGLATLQNDCDYHEFLEYLHEKKKVTVYVDHIHEPLFDWIEMEEPELEDDTNSNEDEVDVIDKEG